MGPHSSHSQPQTHAQRARSAILTVLVVAGLAVAAYLSPVGAGGSINTQSGPSFALSAHLSGNLILGGAPLIIPIKITNLHSAPLRVSEVTVTAGSSSPACSVATNLRVTQANISFTKPLLVPGNGSVTLPARGVAAPTVQFLNLPTNQNGCQGVTFSFRYSALA